MLGVPLGYEQTLKFRRFLNIHTSNAPDVAKPFLRPRIPVQDAQRGVLVVMDNLDGALFNMSTWFALGKVTMVSVPQDFRGMIVDVDTQMRGIFSGILFDRGLLWGTGQAGDVHVSRWTWTDIANHRITRWGS